MHAAGRRTGTGTNDNDVLFTQEQLTPYDTFMLASTTGAVDVEVSLDGTNFVGPVSLTDMGATTSDPVLVTAADRLYGFRGVGFHSVRVIQNGATASEATLTYGTMG